MKIKIFEGSDGKFYVKEKGWFFWWDIPLVFSSEEAVKWFYKFRKEKEIISEKANKANKKLIFEGII
jgi:hypothetical protein